MLLVWSFSSCRSAVNSSTSRYRPTSWSSASRRGGSLRRRLGVGAGLLEPLPEPGQEGFLVEGGRSWGIGQREEDVEGSRRVDQPGAEVGGERVERIARGGLEELGLEPTGRVAHLVVGRADGREPFGARSGGNCADQFQVAPADLRLVGVRWASPGPRKDRS